MELIKRLRKRKAYNAEYDFHGNEIIGDDPDKDCQEAADEIERLREQVEFERASLQAAFGELRKLDGDIEWMREVLQNIADGPRDVEKSYISLLHEVRYEARAAIAKATGGE